MKLLVIEDDREAAAYISKGLGESGYVVDRRRRGPRRAVHGELAAATTR